MTTKHVAALKHYLQSCSTLDAAIVANLLGECWVDLAGGSETAMHGGKLKGRIEQPSWNPPILQFWIERHGETVLGSTRGTIYKWSVDLDALTAQIVEQKQRQLHRMDGRLDVKPIAESIANAIVSGCPDERIKIGRDGSVRLNISLIISAKNQQTITSRRKRFRHELEALLAPRGWKPDRVNVYVRVEGSKGKP